jgi:hypothetical protein
MTEHEIADHATNGRTHAKSRRTLSPYFIGDPDLATLDTPAGPPDSCPGNADAELSAAALPGLEIRAATVRGVQRRANRKPRQAAFALGRRSELAQNEQPQNAHAQNEQPQNERAQNAHAQNEQPQNERAQNARAQNARAQNARAQNARAQNEREHNAHVQNKHTRREHGQHKHEPNKHERHKHESLVRAIAVVCDGVSTYGSAEETSLLVSRHLVGLAAAGVPWPESFADASKTIGAHVAAALLAGRNAADAHGMATTAAGLVVHRDCSDWVGDAAWVGDSSVWHLDRHGHWALLAGRPAVADDVAPTRSLPSEDGTCTTRHFQVSGGAIFVMTDGVASALQRSARVRDTLADWWARPPDPFTFAAQVAFARRAHTDDRTVVGIWPDPT